MSALSLFAILLFAAAMAFAFRVVPTGIHGKPLMSCYTLVLGLFGVYFLMPAVLLLVVTDGRYIWLPLYGGSWSLAITTFVATAGLLLYMGGYFLRSRSLSPVPVTVAPISGNPLCTQIAFALIGIGMLLKLFVMVSSGGLEMTILRQSSGVSQALRIEEVNPILAQVWFLSSIADAGACWVVMSALQQRKPFGLLILLFVAVTALSFVGTGKRLYALWPLLTVGLGFHFYRRPLRVSLLPVGILLGLGLGFASLLFRIYAPASIANVNIDLYRVPWAEGSLFRFYFMSLEFASFELFTMVIESSETLVRLFGNAWDAFVTTNILPLGYLVPRILWPSKPEIFIDMSHANRMLMFGGSLEKGFGVASMLPGTSFTISGPVGYAIAMAGLGWFTAAADRARSLFGRPPVRNVIIYAFIITTTFHLFRQGTIGWVAIIVVVQQLGMILGFGALFFFDARIGRVRASAPAL